MLRRALAPVGAALAIAACGSHAVHQPAPLHGGRTHAPGFGQPPKGDFGIFRYGFSAIPGVEGYDAVTLSNVPRSALAVGCYDSGRYVNCPQAERDFPHAHIVTIATYSGAAAKCLDTEPGDSTPSQVPGWVRWMLGREYRPCDYADAAEMPAVEADLNAAGIPRGDYLLFVADWDGNPAIPGGFDAKQWDSNCCVDRDSFATYFFSAPPKPAPQPKPKPSTFDQQFDVGFNRGFVVGDDRRRNRRAPAFHTRVSDWRAFNDGFTPGFRDGWKAARR